jgi:hypothetical protein
MPTTQRAPPKKKSSVKSDQESGKLVEEVKEQSRPLEKLTSVIEVASSVLGATVPNKLYKFEYSQGSGSLKAPGY